MRRPRIWLRIGVTRAVIVTGRYAIKVPNLRHGMWGLAHGVLANQSERDWSGFDQGALPQLRCWLGGLIAIYPRAYPVIPGINVPATEPPHGDPWWRSVAPNLPSWDAKFSNLGMYRGRLVWIDYATVGYTQRIKVSGR